MGYNTNWTFRINICNNVLYRDDNREEGFFDKVAVYGLNDKNANNEKNSSLG